VVAMFIRLTNTAEAWRSTGWAGWFVTLGGSRFASLLEPDTFANKSTPLATRIRISHDEAAVTMRTSGPPH